ncbi:hypothetical protein A7U60_g8573 [Sanghuangporus baumii]|uniref:Uncharacterized protein n=1 Tax=Sanghuangporus baumii TaxID=108892 RepID=A0A9Q5N3K0_SANBA|nr:hypothetical protein A7U60_g8573 [Sanghuangporus baumii]
MRMTIFRILDLDIVRSAALLPRASSDDLVHRTISSPSERIRCPRSPCSMPPMKSRLSENPTDCSFSFSDQETLIGQDVAWYQEPVFPSDELHDYARQPNRGQPSKRDSIPPTVHTFSLPPGADGVPLLSVNLHSWAASSTKTPTFMEGQYISGQVQLNLRTPDKVKTITVSVEGYYSIPGYEAKTFLQVSETIWDSTMGDPRSTSILLPHGADHSGKLHGKYSWSFKSEFPKAVQLTGKDERRLVHDARNGERLPPSLRGGHGRARIGYEIIVRVKRPGLRIGNSPMWNLALDE